MSDDKGTASINNNMEAMLSKELRPSCTRSQGEIDYFKALAPNDVEDSGNDDNY